MRSVIISFGRRAVALLTFEQAEGQSSLRLGAERRYSLFFRGGYQLLLCYYVLCQRRENKTLSLARPHCHMRTSQFNHNRGSNNNHVKSCFRFNERRLRCKQA